MGFFVCFAPQVFESPPHFLRSSNSPVFVYLLLFETGLFWNLVFCWLKIMGKNIWVNIILEFPLKNDIQIFFKSIVIWLNTNYLTLHHTFKSCYYSRAAIITENCFAALQSPRKRRNVHRNNAQVVVWM